MFNDIIVVVLIAIGVAIVFISHENLCKFPKMIGVDYCVPHWVFVYMMSPAIIFVAYFIKHRSAGFIDFAIDSLRDLTENPNKE